VNQAEVIVALDQPRPVYHPGDVLTAQYRLAADEPCHVQRIEASLVWHTEGKGDADLGVHHFERVELTEVERQDTGQVRQLKARLPRSPLSYDGLLIKVRWCVRVRVFLVNGRELTGETPFQLGEVARAQEAEA
jgi:hypothetical protein